MLLKKYWSFCKSALYLLNVLILLHIFAVLGISNNFLGHFALFLYR